jgi:AcrR family transcriptional regulator
MSAIATPPEGEPRRSWRGVSSAERTAERHQILLDAAFDLVGTEGWAALTVRGICRATRLHPRYFYQAFRDVDDLLVAVFDRLIGELGDAIAEAIAGTSASGNWAAGKPASLAQRARAGLNAVAHFVADDRRRARVLYAEALGNDRLNHRRLEAMQQFVDLLGTAGRSRPGRGGHAAQVAAYIAVGGFTNLLVAWLDGRIDVTLDELVDDATAILVAAGEAAAGVGPSRRGRSAR